MMARICASMAGGDPMDFMPKFKQEQAAEDLISSMGGMQEFIIENDIEVDDGDY